MTAAKRRRPSDLGAYELYLLAQDLLFTDLTVEGMTKAEKLLDRAIQIDPTLARAYVTYAWTYSWRHTLEAGARELMHQMVNYARKAVELDPLDANAHLALGFSLTLSGDLRQGDVQLTEALRINPNSFFINAVYGCMAHNYGKAEAGAKGADWAIRLNPNFPAWAIPCLRLAMVMVGRYEDVVRIQSRQTEDLWNTDGFVIMAGSLAMLGHDMEAKALAQRGVAKFPGLLSIERFALNRGWPPAASAVMVGLMRKAGFPVCATEQELADTARPARLPECVKT